MSEHTLSSDFERRLVADQLDRTLFEAATMQFKSKAVMVETGFSKSTIFASA